MKRYLFFLFFSFIYLLACANPKHEIRAVWLTTNYGLDWPSRPAKSRSDIQQQKRELDLMLDELKKAHFNMVFFQARLRGDVVYPSKIEPVSSYIRSGNFYYPDDDMLAYAIEACHQRGLECHAWFVAYPLGREKIDKKDNPSPTVRKNSHLVRTFNKDLYFDPGEPETRNYLLSLIQEIVVNYDVDGIHFDYIRYPDKSDKFPDQDSYKRYGKGKDKARWRRENINQFVYSAYDLVKKLKPWVQVSSSVVGMHNKINGNTSAHWSGYQDVYQDAADWMEKGKHDFIVPMMYYSGNLFYPFVQDWLSKSHGRFVVPGLGLYQMDKNESDWPAEIILDQLRFSRKNNTQGNAFYRAKHLTDNKKGILSSISREYYTSEALLPPLNWLSDTIPQSATYTKAVLSAKNSMYLFWSETKENLTYNIYCSETFPVDTENPENLIATSIRGNKCEIFIDNSVISGHYYIVTSYDRYHQESTASPSVYFVTGEIEK